MMTKAALIKLFERMWSATIWTNVNNQGYRTRFKYENRVYKKFLVLLGACICYECPLRKVCPPKR